MCYLCDMWGDPKYGGGLWYLNPKNYARHMYTLRLPGERPMDRMPTDTDAYRDHGQVPMMVDAMERGDEEEFERLKQEVDQGRSESTSAGQIVPLEDAYKIVEICSPIALMYCSCRLAQLGREERNESEYTCMGMGVGMLKWERWPERYRGGVKFLNIEEAKEWLRKMNKRGFVHYLMNQGSPYVGGFCQCDYPGCNAITRVLDFGSVGRFAGIGTRKAHYVAEVDYDECNSCGICAARCQFGALKFEVTSGKPNIDQFKCWGCGLCNTGCPRGAIRLLTRKSIQALAEAW